MYCLQYILSIENTFLKLVNLILFRIEFITVISLSLSLSIYLFISFMPYNNRDNIFLYYDMFKCTT